MITYAYSRAYILVEKNRILVLSFKPLICNISYRFIRLNGNSLLHIPLAITGRNYLKGNIQNCVKSKIKQESEISGFLY